MAQLRDIWIATTCLKVLLFEAYHSTDFEVHRNWLAITHNLPLKQWYIESTSQWTLDYPPFFAWFEWLLSQLVPKTVAQDGCLDITEHSHFGYPTIVFQRTTVIVTEILLFVGLEWYIIQSITNDRNDSNESHLKKKQNNGQDLYKSKSLAKYRAYATATSIALSPGLLIIDHIHFQYNGFMYGILVFSITAAMANRLLLSGFLFAVLLCFKHIYLYLAPAYFGYLLRAYIFKNNRLDLYAGIKLGSAVIGPFAVAIGPFVYYDQIPQLLSRLFPFSRGLTHAYWAPNVWALYSFTDRVLSILYKVEAIGSTRGLVGDVNFAILPDIQPRLTFFLTLFYQVLAVIPVIVWPSYDRFVACLTLCGYASFLFGWHVHEKAILLVIFPFTFIALKDRRVLSAFVPLVVAGYISLFPLIFTSGEELIKVVYTFVWFLIFLVTFNNLVAVRNTKRRVFLLDRLTLIYMIGFVPVTLFSRVIDYIAPTFQFLKLMSISVYCAIGIVGSWAGFSWLYFFDDDLWA